MAPIEFEKSSQGVRFVTALTGPYDGCQLEMKYTVTGELKVSLQDDANSSELESESFIIGIHTDSESNQTLLMRPTAGTIPEEIKELSTLWLMEVRDLPAQWDSGETFEKNDDRLREIRHTLTGESKMAEFYRGNEVVLHSGLYLQTYWDDSIEESWQIEMGMHDGKEYVGWIDGEIVIEKDRSLWFTIKNWESECENDCWRQDVLALALRLIHSRAGNVKVVHRGEIQEIKNEDVIRRSKFWLGF